MLETHDILPDYFKTKRVLIKLFGKLKKKELLAPEVSEVPASWSNSVSDWSVMRNQH